MMGGSINQYGDQLIENSGRGSDIASQRFDELDQSAYAHAMALAASGRLAIADVGAGRCAFINHLAHDLSQSGLSEKANLFAVDSGAFGHCAGTGVHFVMSDMIAFLRQQPPLSLDIVYCQRTIHYLPYSGAGDFTRSAYHCLRPGGFIFLSASGIFSELSDGYPHGSSPVERRFSRLSPVMQEKHGIREPVCLYAPAELEQLVSEAGFSVDSVKSSTFGNVKLIGHKYG